MPQFIEVLVPCLATLPVRLPERVNEFCEPSSAEPQVKWAEFATTVRLIIFPPIIVLLVAWRAETGTRGDKWRVTYIRRLEPSCMDLQPSLETTGHNWKREKGSPLIRQRTVIPLGIGYIYPRICNHGAIDGLSDQLYSPVVLSSRIWPPASIQIYIFQHSVVV